MNAVNKFESREIKAAIASVITPTPSAITYTPKSKFNCFAAYCSDDTNQHTPCPDYNCTTCPSSKCTINNNKPIKALELPSIKEVVPTPPYKDKPDLVQLEKKFSNASVHKKRRGLSRRLSQRQRICMQQQDMRGLTRVKILHDNTTLTMQNDPGSNRNICNKLNLLLNYKRIHRVPIGGIKKDQTAIYADGKGFFPWRSSNGDILLIEMLACPEAECTLLCPTAIVNQYPDVYYGWTLRCNQDEQAVTLELLNRDGINHSKFDTYMENDLWYHYAPDAPSRNGKAVVHALTQRASFELWHHRLGHTCSRTVENMYKFATGVPKLKEPPFYKCGTCLAGKMKKSSHCPPKTTIKKPPDPEELIRPGQHLHMDFGFVRGSSWHSTNDEGKLITSIDGQRAYLIIVDRATRYKWIFNTTTKKSPLAQVESVLNKFKPSLVNLHCTIRTDQGGEIGKSNKFRSLIKQFDYIYEPTGSQSSSQNGVAEKPNQDIKNMTKSLLHAAGLGPEYWSYAMNHAVYLYNRLYHSTMRMTPFQKLRHSPPSLKHLRVFGSKVYYKHTRKNLKNLDLSTDHGIFLGYTATARNVYIKSSSSNKILIGTHTSFDGSHMSSLSGALPPMAIAMREAGYNNDGTSPQDTKLPVDRSGLKVQLLSSDVKAPERGTSELAGLDVTPHFLCYAT